MTAKVSFTKNQLRFLTSSAAHVSLSLYATVKEQTVKPSKLPAETRVPTNQHPPIKETLKRRTSSPAAPPPSFSDRAYRPHPSHTSTGNRKKSTRSNNTLKIHTKFKRELSTARSASPNQQNQNQNHSPIGRKALPRARETPSLTLTSP